jgi:hypothetical protein
MVVQRKAVSTIRSDGKVTAIPDWCHGHRCCCLGIYRSAVAIPNTMLFQVQHGDNEALLLLLDVAEVTGD